MKKPLAKSKSNGRITCVSFGKKPGMPTSLAFRPEEVLDRLERKYQSSDSGTVRVRWLVTKIDNPCYPTQHEGWRCLS